MRPAQTSFAHLVINFVDKKFQQNEPQFAFNLITWRQLILHLDSLKSQEQFKIISAA